MAIEVFSFFSGLGFMDLGFEEAGFDIAFVNEYRGKVPTKYFVRRFYGVEDTCEIPQEEGKEWFHA